MGTDEALGIYLNDHLAGATAGTELARRLAGVSQTQPGGQVLATLAAEVAEDRATLISIMSRLGVPTRRYKVLLGWLMEKAGRLKPNGHLLSRTELALLVELEAMLLGVHGKAAAWRTLRTRAESDPRLDAGRLDTLIDRAAKQLETLEALRTRTAADVVGGPAPFERRSPS
jgi:hypothetical protein